MAGRPSKYDPEYCEQIVEFMSNGYSVMAFAGSIRVSRSTVYKWAEGNPSFSDALKAAQAAAAQWWEDRLRQVAATGEGNAAAAIFALKNRASDEWREKQEVEHRGQMAVSHTLDTTQLSEAALREIAGLKGGE